MTALSIAPSLALNVATFMPRSTRARMSPTVTDVFPTPLWVPATTMVGTLLRTLGEEG